MALKACRPLRETAAKKGILFGAALEPEILRKDRLFADAVSKECNLIVAEGATKWEALHPTPDTWNFSGGDALYDFALRNGMKMRGHTLIWEAAFPDWAKEALKEGRGEALMEEYIHTVMSHYHGKFVAWDVVNEAVEPRDGRKDFLRNTPWLQAFGADLY